MSLKGDSLRVSEQVTILAPCINEDFIVTNSSPVNVFAHASPRLDFKRIDGTRHLHSSYRLRYQVYCRERGFLSPMQFPNGEEADHFDPHSIHFGALTPTGETVGTLRLVLHSNHGFPLSRFCQVWPEESDQLRSPRVAEISRLAFSKTVRRQVADRSGSKGSGQVSRMERMRIRQSEMVMGLYGAMYQESKRQGITHWLAAMEESLVRLLRRHNFWFTPIGPQIDYYGPVTPYMASIAEIEEAVYHHCPSMFWALMEGLDMDHRPVQARAA